MHKRRFAALLSSRIAASVLQAATVIVIGRSADIQAFGILGIAISTATVVTTLFDLGVSTLLARAVALDDTRLVASLLQLSRRTTWLLAALSIPSLLAASLFGLVPAW